MNPANTKARLLREKLLALIARGVGGEADSAKRKLARLERAYDFTAPNPDGGDLFADALEGIAYMHRGNDRALAETFADSELACFVKWAIQAAYGIEGKLKENPDRTFTLIVEAAAESMKTMNFIARTLHNAFRDLLAQFLALPGASTRDGRLFIRAVYDGCLNDEKAAGERLPSPVAAKVRKGRRRSLAVAPALAVHPYSIGLEMGRRVRLRIPIEQIAGDLKNREEVARLAACTSNCNL